MYNLRDNSGTTGLHPPSLAVPLPDRSCRSHPSTSDCPWGPSRDIPRMPRHLRFTPKSSLEDPRSHNIITSVSKQLDNSIQKLHFARTSRVKKSCRRVLTLSEHSQKGMTPVSTEHETYNLRVITVSFLAPVVGGKPFINPTSVGVWGQQPTLGVCFSAGSCWLAATCGNAPPQQCEPSKVQLLIQRHQLLCLKEMMCSTCRWVASIIFWAEITMHAVYWIQNSHKCMFADSFLLLNHWSTCLSLNNSKFLFFISNCSQQVFFFVVWLVEPLVM